MTGDDSTDGPAAEGTGPGDQADPVTGPLRVLRTDPGHRKIALSVATLVGLALAWAHWLGLVLAGALVGLVSETPRRALLAGLGMGVAVLVVHVAASPAMGAGEFLAASPPSHVAVAAALLLPVWGSLVRYAV